jgi:hypothetical protein
MARRRRSRSSQRTLLQLGILTVALAFIALDNPATRASVNTTLVWLSERGLVLAIIVLAIMWTYSFTRDRETAKRKPAPRAWSEKRRSATLPRTGTHARQPAPRGSKPPAKTPSLNPMNVSDDCSNNDCWACPGNGCEHNCHGQTPLSNNSRTLGKRHARAPF